MLDPFLREISHVAGAPKRLTEIDRSGLACASDWQQVIAPPLGLVSANQHFAARKIELAATRPYRGFS
jgi:hypothetical protein